MKNSLLTFFAMFSLALNAQFRDGVVNFETAPYIIREDFVKLDVVLYPGAGNIWQAGKPNKTFFDSAYSPVNAMVTDTLNPYPVNSYSYFDVVIHGNEFFGFMSMFSFKHKYNTTKGKDGGYIMTSIDNGITWDTLINANNNMDDWCWGCPVQNKSSIYNYTDTLTGGMPAYSGTSNGWVTSSIRFGIMPLKNEPFDTLIFRFIFQSDSIAETDSNEGWMIDDIYLSIHYSSGIRAVSSNNNHIYPNPSSSGVTISNSQAEILKVKLVNLLGTVVKSEEYIYSNSITMDISGLAPGVYLTEVLTGEGLSVHKIVIE